MVFNDLSLILFDKKTWIMIACIAAAVLLLILYISVHFSKGKRKGRAAERKVAKVLKKLGKPDHVRIINNAYLPLYNKACEVDHLVFGRFGVLVVETKGISGTVTGSGKTLTHTIGSKTHKFYNPQMQNKTHIDNVIHHLRKGGFDKTPVNGAVVFSDKDIEFPSEIGMDLKGLEKYYSSLPDAGCNQDVLYNYFSDMQVKNPFKKMWIRTRKKND